MNERELIQKAMMAKTPLTVAAIANSADLKLDVTELSQACDVVELRLDSLGWNDSIIDFAKACPLPLLMTARGAAEGGVGGLTLEQRTEAYRTMMPQAALIDIEMRDFSALTEVIEEAREAGVVVVGSFHDFEKTPSLETLLEKLATTADLHKFALQTQEKDDLMTLLELLDEETPLSVMGMGPLGAAARPLMGKAGSILNYGFVGNTPTAPGQWPAKLLKETLKV